jgi:protein-disulfide isomerase
MKEESFMHPFRGRTALALGLALGTMVFAQACSKKSEKSEEQAPAGAAVSQADIEKTVGIAKEKLDRLRFNLGLARETKIEVLGGVPARLPGFVELRLRVAREDRTAVRHVTVTPDMQFVILSRPLHLGEIPRPRVDLANVDTKGAPERGAANAPVTIVEYSDFQCPYCRASQEMLHQVLQEYEGKVKLVYRHYPLSIHPWAQDAALLSVCARRQKPEVFWKLHDFYYANSQGMSRDNILARTQEQVKGDGIDINRLNKCYLDQETAPIIKKSLDEGKIIGIRGTPVFLVNDVFMSGAQPYPVMSAIILEELGHDWTKDPSPKELQPPKAPKAANAEQAGGSAQAPVAGAQAPPAAGGGGAPPAAR